MVAPNLLVLSHVRPVPAAAGQNQRVNYTLKAARERFHVTFATYGRSEEVSQLQDQMRDLCDDLVVLPSQYSRSTAIRAFHGCVAKAYSRVTGLKESNYLIDRLEFSPARVSELANRRSFNCVLYEYWHAARSTDVFRKRGIPTILDTHNVLWRAYDAQLKHVPSKLPGWVQDWRVGRYRAAERHAWQAFDGLIAINQDERSELQDAAPSKTHFYAPMGVDLAAWPYRWQAVEPIRIAYYGGLGSTHNQRNVQRCLEEIMPSVWRQVPQAGFWAIGSNPPAWLQKKHSPPQVNVTGFVPDLGELLAGMRAVVCPWSGRYGFRSRLVEVMATGTPLVVSSDAIFGMDLTDSHGVDIADNSSQMAEQILRLVRDPLHAAERSRLARRRCEEIFDARHTYGSLMDQLCQWIGAAQ